MRTILSVLLLLLCVHGIRAQITTPIIKAGFGIDGELQTNFFYETPQSGNDDWFSNSPGSGQFVIDTTGAAAMLSQYAVDADFRRLPFYRTMSADPYSLMNNFRVIDAVFIRDYHGSDSTIFASGSNKNGMSPADWSCPVAQSIPDKNEILDMMMHVRRAGPDKTDSLWMFGGLSIENTVGNRYFDFEMYQTDIYYDRGTRKFYGYGMDAGHTSWQFDAAGNITRPGDIIFSAEYSSSVLTKLEARIWIDQASLSATPTAFNWTGSFDGAFSGAQFGYAGISPNTIGSFYTGLSSLAGTWAGPFALITGDNAIGTTYTAGQFMEFSVNLTKLGLDPVTLLGGDDCGMPFRRVLVKSRSSTSFTSALKDFVGPFDFFRTPEADAQADVPFYCGVMGVSELKVINPVSTSIYNWTTMDGNIIGDSSGTSTTVDAPGTYILTQKLQAGCSTYASDTVVITYDSDCMILRSDQLDFQGIIKDEKVQLSWATGIKQGIKYFEVERSTNGVVYRKIETVTGRQTSGSDIGYMVSDDLEKIAATAFYYRLKIIFSDGQYRYSKVVRLQKVESNNNIITAILPNPVRESARISIFSPRDLAVRLFIYSLDGRLMRAVEKNIQKGRSFINLSGLEDWPKTVYLVKILAGNKVFTDHLVLTK